MGKSTGIAWCDSTFNPWIGCQKVSPGCKFCYAERETFVRRERSHGHELWGPMGSRHRTSAAYWREPITWNAQTWVKHECGWRGDFTGIKALDGCPACGVRTGFFPTRRRVFCMSLGDVFEERDELIQWRNDLYNLIDATPNLDWLLLSKRIELAGQMLPYLWVHSDWPPNVWIGTSVEDQALANERIPELMRLPALIRFVSAEPLLGPIDLTLGEVATEKPNWVIVGGESGPHCRPFDWNWARGILQECRIPSPIPYFMKQGGGYPNKRDNLDDLPEDLRIREWPK